MKTVSFALVCTAMLISSCDQKKTEQSTKTAQPEPAFPVKSNETQKNSNAPAVTLASASPDFSMTSEAFHREFKEDGAAAHRKYDGKLIELTGEVGSFGRNSVGPYLFLKIKKTIGGVSCAFAEAEPWAKAVGGQKIRLKGRCDSLGDLTDCVFVDAGKYEGMTCTAADLAKEYSSNPEGMEKKYERKHLIVTGEVEKIEFNDAGSATIILKVPGKLRVEVNCISTHNDLTKLIKAGDKIKVISQECSFYQSRNVVSLSDCIPFKKQ